MTTHRRVRNGSVELGAPRSAWHGRLASIPGLLAVAVLAATLALGLTSCRDTSKTVPLPALGAIVTGTSVSGISSGAYMAGQFQLAHGDVVVGAGIIAGGPYGCAESIFAGLMPGPGSAMINATKAINGCMLNAMKLWNVPNPPALADRAHRLAQSQAIAPIDQTISDRVYLFSGKSDRTVAPPIVAAAATFYNLLGMPQNQIKFVTDINAGHAFVTENQGAECTVTAKPYVVDCDYDQAGELLSFIYGQLNPPSAKPDGSFIVFDQRSFTSDLPTHGMDDAGVVYVPQSCRDGGNGATAMSSPNTPSPGQTGCRVHIAFHGCGQNRALAGDAFVHQTGFTRWADNNRLIVLFPQAAASALNPQGCWDWWGYTGRDYLTRKAPQIIAVRRMLGRLAGLDQPS